VLVARPQLFIELRLDGKFGAVPYVRRFQGNSVPGRTFVGLAIKMADALSASCATGFKNLRSYGPALFS
jgi:hypothetical protein